MILINSALTLLMLGTPQTSLGRRYELPHAGQRDCSAVQAEEPARHDLVHWREWKALRTEQQAVSCQLFHSADRFRPSRLGENGLALEPGFIHATCRLVLRRSSAKFANSTETFEIPLFAKLSAFVRLAAPCGVAAARATSPLGVQETMQQKQLKRASNMQAYQFAKTGKAEPNLVTLPRLTHCGTVSRRLVPQETFDPLRQHPLLLEAGSKGRRAFVDFLKGLEPQGGVARHGCAWQAWS